MRIWRRGGRYDLPREDVMVQPGVFHPETSDFMDKETGKPTMFNVVFRYGQSDEIPDNLGQYLIDQGLAQGTRFILSR